MKQKQKQTEHMQAPRAKHNQIAGLKNTSFKIGDEHRAIIKRNSDRREMNGSAYLRELIEGEK